MKTLTARDKRMFRVAREVAKTSDFKPHRLGCVIAYKHHIVSVGANSEKTSPVQKKYNKKYRQFTKTDKPIFDSLHAEIDCISNISYTQLKNYDWKKAKIYIYRICKGKPLGMGLARPCPSCMQAIKDLGIKTIYYTTDDGYAVERLEY